MIEWESCEAYHNGDMVALRRPRSRWARFWDRVRHPFDPPAYYERVWYRVVE